MPKAIATIQRPGGQPPKRVYDEARGSACARGYGRRHEKWRLLILHRDPLCRIAKLCGGMAPSTVADHVIPLRSRWDRLTAEQRDRVRRFFGSSWMDPAQALRDYLWSEDNGQGACKRCHDWKTRQESGRSPLNSHA